MTRLEDRAWIPEAEAWMVREKTKPLGMDLETRCQILGTAVDAWAKKEMPRVAAVIAKDLGYAEPMVLEGFRRMVEAHRQAHLREWVQESRGQDQGVSKTGQFDRVVGYVVAGNVPGLSVLALIEGLLSGSAVFLKLPETDQETAPSFLRILEAIDSTMASKVRANYWPGGEREIESVLFPRLDRLFVSGQETTIRELQKTYGEKVEGFGPRYSVAVLEAEPEAGLPSFA
ncbi:MAG: hypothetical protein HKN21_06130, partial [Candidatus Eisenbacteria bacterium]|nr:hypothetical protein [Candidatus Eisenbacteria bacterium]